MAGITAGLDKQMAAGNEMTESHMPPLPSAPVDTPVAITTHTQKNALVSLLRVDSLDVQVNVKLDVVIENLAKVHAIIMQGLGRSTRRWLRRSTRRCPCRPCR